MFGRRPGKEDLQAMFARSREELERKQVANAAAWGFGETDRWDADLELGVIKFGASDGFTVTAPVQIVGTYDSNDSTWLWGWDHPSVDEPLAQAARLARDYGAKHGFSQFTDRMFTCSKDEAWRFTAVALHLSGAAGAYRGPAGSTYVFMTFGEVTVQQVH